MTGKVTDEEVHIDGGPSCQPFARAVSWLQIALVVDELFTRN